MAQDPEKIPKKSRSLFYMLILIIISTATGLGFYWYSSLYEPEITSATIVHHKKAVLGAENAKIQPNNDNDNVLDIPVKVNEPIPDRDRVIEVE